MEQAELGFNIVEKLLALTLLGTEWVLWLLLALSVISIAIMLERAIFFSRIRLDYTRFTKRLNRLLADEDIDGAKKLCEESQSLESQMVLQGLNHAELGVVAMAGSMEGFRIGEKQKLDRGLVVLGTLGNNAPFIGLFGTVVGIIIAVNNLAKDIDGGFAVVMAGISEALVATAIGLLVAIPAVIAFNFFNRIVKRIMANSEAISRVVLTYFHEQQGVEKP
ncbi:MAG: MotA/TolQ/ExbB proton channel family protein [Bdellovibrionota bacterium]